MSNNGTRVTAIIPNYNNARFVLSAVQRVLDQDYEPVEVIVVDDGSTDNSLSVLNGFGREVTVVSRSNGGPSAARNAGIKASHGDILAFLDADDLWEPQKLRLQVERMLSDPDVGLVHCAVEDIDEEGRPVEIHADGMEGWVADELLRYQRPVILGGGSGAIVRRDVIEEIGGFDESLRIGEDWEFYYRVARRYKVAFVEKVLVKYRRHSTNSYAGNSRAVTLMKENLLSAFDGIFASDVRLAPMKRACYGRIHSVIAGSFFRSGQYGPFLRHALASVGYAPGNLLHFLGFPFRRARGQNLDQ